MRLIKISLIIFLAVGLANIASGQGLYGAPDPLAMSQQTQQAQQPAAVPYAGNAAPYGGQPVGAPGHILRKLPPTTSLAHT